MRTVRVSRRVRADDGVNEIAMARAELAANGVTVTDLTDSNPTSRGLSDPRVLAAVSRHVADAARYDPHPRGPAAARAALASHFGGAADDYWLTSSTSQAYAWLLTLLADPGETVAIPRPGYPLVAPIADFAGVHTVDYRLDYVHPDGWLLDPHSLAACCADPSLRALVAVNPGNPTGAYAAPGDGLVEACARHGLPLISDEVFQPFDLDGAATSLAAAPGIVTFTLGGLSKLLCAPQLKLGWIRLAGPGEQLAAVREGLDTIADAFLPVSAPAAAALPDMLGLADEVVAATRARLAANLAELRRIVADRPYRVRRCAGGWTALLDVPSYLGDDELAAHLLTDAHLAAHPGWFYDLAEPGVLALSLLPEPADFAAGILRLCAAIDALDDA